MRVLAEVVNHPWLLFEMPNAPCAFFAFFDFQGEWSSLCHAVPLPWLWAPSLLLTPEPEPLPSPAAPDALELTLLSQNSHPCLVFVMIMGKKPPRILHPCAPADAPSPSVPQPGSGSTGGPQAGPSSTTHIYSLHLKGFKVLVILTRAIVSSWAALPVPKAPSTRSLSGMWAVSEGKFQRGCALCGEDKQFPSFSPVHLCAAHAKEKKIPLR